jgi:hypothetical protein
MYSKSYAKEKSGGMPVKQSFLFQLPTAECIATQRLKK